MGWNRATAFAGEPAPTGPPQVSSPALYLWERVYPRIGRRGQHFEIRDLQP
ncbi:hypothetical protein DW66_4396 [Pseudomonas putida]|nr:hypothetical protein DW66_4396 [Pseudomonas putida]AJG12039.1 hypothetical protein RK21_00531 [Pseudomonas plecoglossicida]